MPDPGAHLLGRAVNPERTIQLWWSTRHRWSATVGAVPAGTFSPAAPVAEAVVVSLPLPVRLT